jgi:ABC-type antimicrobial peptide transport system permease subunit
MLKTFLTLTFRNLVKNKFFVIVNILGLGTTLACCIVAYLNYRFEADFNNNHINVNKIYKVNVYRDINDRAQQYSISPLSLAPSISNNISGIEQIVRYSTGQLSLRQGNNENSKIFSQRVGFADNEIFNMFTLPVAWGSTSNFADVNTIILSKEASERFFGDTNPVGESITVFNTKGEPIEFTIGAVLEPIQQNSMVRFDAITTFSNYTSLYNLNEMDWKSWVGATFLTIPNPEDIPRIENALNGFIEIQNRAREDWHITRFEVMSLQSFTKISREIWANWLEYNMHPAQIVGPLIMSILILLLASFNYMNTSISTANTRLKEIGVRKVMGSSRGQLIAQFLGENALVCFFALLSSLVIAVFLLNEYNKMWSYMELEMTFAGNYGFWGFLIFLLVFTSILAGSYAAFYISSFKPVDVFKGTYRLKEGGWLSKILLWFQITVSIVAIIAGLVFTQNANFQESIDKGYDMDMIIVVPIAQGVDSKSLKATFESHPDVSGVTFTSQHIGWGGYSRTIELMDKKTEVQVMEIGPDYLKTMGVKFLEGRGLDSEFESSDIANSVVIDKRTVDEMGIKDPIGQVIRIDTLNLKIVGVTDNFHMSFWNKPTPIVFWIRSSEPQGLIVIKTKRETKSTVLDFIKSEWDQQVPFVPFSGFEQSNVEAEALDVNNNITNINLFLAIIAIVLSSLALYTLVSLNIIKRIKEIGIRTVLGSSYFGINMLISKPFIIIVALASISGGVGGYLLSSMLLKSLWPIHVSINTLSIGIPIILTFALAYSIISIRIYTTLTKNPVDSLRYE